MRAMSLSFTQAMLKEGHKHLSGLEEAVVKNIEACKSLSQIARTSLGPNGAAIARSALHAIARALQYASAHAWRAWCACNSAGMSKMVINHLEKLFVTKDASTIMSELEVQHPAAKLLVMAARAQENEIGDGTNLVRGMGTAVGTRSRAFHDECSSSSIYLPSSQRRYFAAHAGAVAGG